VRGQSPAGPVAPTTLLACEIHSICQILGGIIFLMSVRVGSIARATRGHPQLSLVDFRLPLSRTPVGLAEPPSVDDLAADSCNWLILRVPRPFSESGSSYAHRASLIIRSARMSAQVGCSPPSPWLIKRVSRRVSRSIIELILGFW
jgi:hypothetical protein